MPGHRPYRLHRPWTVLGSRELLDADPFLKVRVETVELDAIEAAGGSLRCCIGELFTGSSAGS